MIQTDRKRRTLRTLNLTAEGFRQREQCHIKVQLRVNGLLTAAHYQLVQGIRPMYALSLPDQAHVSSVCRQLFSHGSVSPAVTISHKSYKHTQRLAVSQSEGNVESSSVLHTSGKQTQEECKRTQTHRRVNTPAESEKVLERRVTSLTGAEMVTGVLEAFFTSLFFFFPSLKGCCVVNNTVAFIHTGGPLCVL